jgi:hypothetical protein
LSKGAQLVDDRPVLDQPAVLRAIARQARRIHLVLILASLFLVNGVTASWLDLASGSRAPSNDLEPGRLRGSQAMTYPWTVSVGETRVLGKSLDRLVQARAVTVGIIT